MELACRSSTEPDVERSVLSSLSRSARGARSVFGDSVGGCSGDFGGLVGRGKGGQR